MGKTGEESRDSAQVVEPVVDLLKRHTALPSRAAILSEAVELARKLKSPAGSHTETTGSDSPGAP